MLSQEFIKFLFPMLTVIFSGVFGLLTAVMVWKLSIKREKYIFKRDFSTQDYKNTEIFFVEIIASLNKAISYTRNNKDYSTLHDEMSIILAKAYLLADKTLNDKLASISTILFEWSSEYKQGLPLRIGDTDFGIISSGDSIHTQNAEKIYILLIEELKEMIELMKQQLADLKKQMRTI